MLAGLYDEAAAAYTAALAERDSDAELHAGLIHALVAAKKSKRAAEAAKTARDRFPDDPHVMAAHAGVLFRQAHLPEASNGYQQAITKNPRIPEAWAGMARFYSAMSMPATAENFFRSAFRLEPNSAGLAHVYSNLTDDDEEHIRRLETALALYGEKAEPVPHLRVHIESDKLLRGRKLRDLKSPYGPYEMPLVELKETPARRDGWALDVRFNGKGRARLLVDTGASGILLGANAVKKFGLEVLSNEKTEMRGIGDDKKPKTSATLAKSVSVGDFQLENVPVSVSESRRIGANDGLIGTDVFRRFLVTMDPRRSKFRLAPMDKADDDSPRDRHRTEANKHFTAVTRAGSHFFLPVGINGKASAMFLIDTGAFANLLSEDLSRKVTKLAREDRVQIQGVSGKVNKVSVSYTHLTLPTKA